jgi:hypothetical protein
MNQLDTAQTFARVIEWQVERLISLADHGHSLQRRRLGQLPCHPSDTFPAPKDFVATTICSTNLGADLSPATPSLGALVYVAYLLPAPTRTDQKKMSLGKILRVEKQGLLNEWARSPLYPTENPSTRK